MSATQSTKPYREPGFRHDWFLVSELVKRDFKSRYDRSVLGMFWCILQPTLMMGLLYTVFSQVFRNPIPNFPLYLISGIVFYQFFVEVTSTALRSIRDNAGLITKVKVPLWTYPVTRAVSSLVNFVFALVPLFAVVALTRVPLRPTMLLLFYSTFCMLFFALGVGLFLAFSTTYSFCGVLPACFACTERRSSTLKRRSWKATTGWFTSIHSTT